MPLNIEDYAMLSDAASAALVGRDGSVDWLCLPRYDSASIFGALLGGPEHGRWLVAPEDPDATCTRRYDGDTFVLVTRWQTSSGSVVEVTDFMPHQDNRSDVVRRIRGVSGRTTLFEEVRIRFAYAETLPWVRQLDSASGAALVAVAGPDAVVMRGPKLTSADQRHVATFSVAEGAVVDLQLTWFPSHLPIPEPADVDAALDHSNRWWRDWARLCPTDGPYRDEVRRSMLVLRALTNEATGGIVAAATTSLPEQFGGQRNWDYRYVWLRDAALTLEVLLSHGYESEVEAWRAWLLRAVAGDPDDVQIMYGLAGERYLPERVIDSLPGYRGAAPVRVGNAAVGQVQSDVVGEVLVALHAARKAGLEETDFSWPLQRSLVNALTEQWRRPDQGIWEMRGPAREFTHSRVMVWAAFDRAVRAVTEFGLDGPVEKWAAARDEARAEVEERGFDRDRNTFVQYLGGTEIDASLLVLPQVGFCTPDDPRMLGTVAAIERDLLHDGLVMRYRTHASVDGLPPGEHPFLACSFWLVEQLATSGRMPEATELMDRLVGLVNDVGLLAEEYDPVGRRHVGNTPQAFSHLGLVRAADAVMAGRGSPVQSAAR